MKAAERLIAETVEEGNTRLLFSLASIRELAGDREAATRYALEAADQGDSGFLGVLTERRERDHHPAARRLAHHAADAGCAHALVRLAMLRTSAEETDSQWLWLWRYGLTADGCIGRPW
ncbi:hypothetical protein [Streptomyces sp. Ac-502]|uniref:hypothetical protein n=1 Tax=Streptomyces sp. Ac-502 TaxID=3342801 RepID=UPI0038629498